MEEFFHEPAGEVFKDGAGKHGDEKGEPDVAANGGGHKEDGEHAEAVDWENWTK